MVSISQASRTTIHLAPDLYFAHSAPLALFPGIRKPPLVHQGEVALSGSAALLATKRMPTVAAEPQRGSALIDFAACISIHFAILAIHDE